MPQPKEKWQPLIMQHGSCSPNYGPVLPLSNPILLWVVRNSQLPLDALSCIEVIKLLGGIFIPIICPQYSDFPPSLVLHKSFELLEPIEDLSFGLHEENPRLLREVINEYDIIQTTTQRCRRHRTTYIIMNQIKYTYCSTVTTWKNSLGVLPQITPLAQLLVLYTELWSTTLSTTSNSNLTWKN